MWHKEDDEGDSDEKNDGGGQTSSHLLLPLHFTCEAVLCVVKMMRVVIFVLGMLEAIFAFEWFLK